MQEKSNVILSLHESNNKIIHIYLGYVFKIHAMSLQKYKNFQILEKIMNYFEHAGMTN